MIDRRALIVLGAGLALAPRTVRADDVEPLLMPVEDVFTISGRGTVVTGRIERGTLRVGDGLEIVGLKPTATTTCAGIEAFRKMLDRAEPGDNVGVLLRGVAREDVERGQVLAAPGSITAHAQFSARVEMLTSDAGGRRTPVFTRYRPQLYFRTVDVTGVLTLSDGVAQLAPGDAGEATIELVSPVAMETGVRFAIREGGRVVGGGEVVAILD